jgi:rhodanese-related sulfurtransferase
MNRIIVDVRGRFEYMLGHVDGAVNIPLPKLSGESEVLSGVPKDTEIVLYCNSGNRSGQAVSLLKRYGFTNLINGINKDQVVSKYLN